MRPILQAVFSPFRLNRLELANRVLMSSMHLNFEGDSQYERLAHFYALRAQGGPGLIRRLPREAVRRLTAFALEALERLGSAMSGGGRFPPPGIM